MATASGCFRGLTASRSLKARLRDSQNYRAYGAFLNSASPIIAELMARSGYGFVLVDLEHSPVGIHGAVPMLQAAEAAGVPGLLRVPVNQTDIIKKALDLGPAGVVVPLVHSVEEARCAVAACRYPPRGVRGFAAPLVRASAWGLDSEYVQECEDRHLLFCQIESPEAVEAADAILAVDGVDGVFVGPMDLATAMGHIGDSMHADVSRALARVEAAAARHPSKVLAGFTGGRDPSDMFRAGYRLLASAADLTLLRGAAVADAARGAAAIAMAEDSAQKSEVPVPASSVGTTSSTSSAAPAAPQDTPNMKRARH
eukprot:TRINITY_DN74096_c0_g1_i1.p1 TRINITY_DN74096_c0_g1~~TRINITY_DN74096_c0_g1_i1.p1  ORF type:complete len:313 (+),score=56.95 TRINITY_DN74096_c0_g1_i1:86-1024(+)